MLSSIFADTRTGLAGASATTNKPAQAVSSGSSFSDILVSTTGAGGAPDGRASEQATAAAAGAAENDVDILAKLSGAFRNGGPDGAPDGTLGVATIDRYGNVIAGASLDANGNLSVFGSGSSGGASSEIGMSLSSPSDDGTWYANASAELAQASYELNSLISQSTAAAGVDRAA
jgi:hypothetical protein